MPPARTPGRSRMPTDWRSSERRIRGLPEGNGRKTRAAKKADIRKRYPKIRKPSVPAGVPRSGPRTGLPSSDEEESRHAKRPDGFPGAPAGTRTPDTLLKRQVLYLLSYWGIWQGWQDSDLRMTESKSAVLPLHHIPVQRRNNTAEKESRRSPLRDAARLLRGVDDRVRTDDPQGHNLVL